MLTIINNKTQGLGLGKTKYKTDSCPLHHWVTQEVQDLNLAYYFFVFFGCKYSNIQFAQCIKSDLFMNER